MTPREFAAALKAVGLTQTEFARRARMSRENVNRWAKGKKPIPGWVDWIMELLPPPDPGITASGHFIPD